MVNTPVSNLQNKTDLKKRVEQDYLMINRKDTRYD